MPVLGSCKNILMLIRKISIELSTHLDFIKEKHMIKNLLIENFKAFGDMQSAELGKITLIYGPNSGGKTSIIQSLLLLKQSFGDVRGSVPSFLPNGDYLNLGAFNSFVHKHEARKVTLGVKFESKRDKTKLYRTEDQTLRLLFCAQSAKKYFGNEIVDAFYFAGREDGLKVHFRKVRRVNDCFMNLGEQDFYEWGDDSSIHSLARFSLSRTSSDELVEADYERFASKLRETVILASPALPSELISVGPTAHYTTAAQPDESSLMLPGFSQSYKPNDPITAASSTLNFVASQFISMLGGVSYLGPLRMQPSRLHFGEEEQGRSVGTKGEFAPMVLFKRSNEISKPLDDWMEKFEIPYTISVKRMGDRVTGDLITVRLKDKNTNTILSPADVGFGIGQLLPLLIQGLVSQKRTICVEQPEIHLHPRLQAHFGDFLLSTIAEPFCNQWLIETHSESLMLRLQRRIKEKKLSASDIVVLYVMPGMEGSTVLRLRLDENGDFIDEWPQGFFEESFQEMFLE